MSSEKDNILKFNQYIKSDKMPYITYADVESLIKNIGVCANNPDKILQQKKYVSIFFADIQYQQFGNLVI